MRRIDSLQKTLMLGKIDGRRRSTQQRIILLDGITDEMGISFSRFRELVVHREAWHAAVHGVAKSQIQLRNWAEVTSVMSTLCDPIKCRPSGSSVHEILHAGILEWVFMPSFRESSCPGIQPGSPTSTCTGKQILYH